jgi:hypothetical protein
MLYARRKRLPGIFNFLAMMGLLCMTVLGLATLLPSAQSPFFEAVSIGLLAFFAFGAVLLATRGAFEFGRMERLFLVGVLAISLTLYIAIL